MSGETHSGQNYVNTELGQLFVKEAGTGETTIVLWPSIFTDHTIYQTLIEKLQANYRFLLIDGPGHGRSEGPTREFTAAQSANAMVAVLDHYRIEKAVVGGTSWGGLTAAELSLTQPHRVSELILLNTPMLIDGRNPTLSARLIAFGARYGLPFAMMRNGVAKSFFTPDALHQNPEYEQQFHTMLKQANPKQLSAAVRSVILNGQPLIDRLSEISVPTLVVAGEADTMYPLSVQRDAAARIPNAKFEVVEGKHISVIEQPEAVAGLLQAFLSSKKISSQVN